MLVVLTLVLLVAIAAGVAAVASGAGDRMSSAEQDVVDPGLPSTVVHAGTVASLRLPVAVRGYRMQQVDDVLDRLADELRGRDEVLREVADDPAVPERLRIRATGWLPPAEPAGVPAPGSATTDQAAADEVPGGDLAHGVDAPAGDPRLAVLTPARADPPAEVDPLVEPDPAWEGKPLVEPDPASEGEMLGEPDPASEGEPASPSEGVSAEVAVLQQDWPAAAPASAQAPPAEPDGARSSDLAAWPSSVVGPSAAHEQTTDPLQPDDEPPSAAAAQEHG